MVYLATPFYGKLKWSSKGFRQHLHGVSDSDRDIYLEQVVTIEKLSGWTAKKSSTRSSQSIFIITFFKNSCMWCVFLVYGRTVVFWTPSNLYNSLSSFIKFVMKFKLPWLQCTGIRYTSFDYTESSNLSQSFVVAMFNMHISRSR